MGEQDNVPQQDNSATPLSPTAASPAAALAPILQGNPQAPDMFAPIAQFAAQWLQHSISRQPPPTDAVQQQAAQKAAAAQPVNPSAAPQAPKSDDDDSGAPAPGSMAAKLAGAASGVAGALGDAAHATDRPGGWLSGVVNTLNARNARLAQEKKDDILNARNSAENVALHRNAHQQDEALVEKNLLVPNRDYANKLKLNHDQVEIDRNTMNQQIKDAGGIGKYAALYDVKQTGTMPVSNPDGSAKKINGDIVTEPVYTRITRATKDGKPEAFEADANMSEGLGKFGLANVPVGTKLTQGQHELWNTQLTASNMTLQQVQNGNGKPFPPEQVKTLGYLLTDPTIQAAVADGKGNAYAGIRQHLDNAEAMTAQLQGQIKQLSTATGPQAQQALDLAKDALKSTMEETAKLNTFTKAAIDDKQITAYNTKMDKQENFLDTVQNDPSKMKGNEAAVSAMVDQRLKDPNTSAPEAVKLHNLKSQAEASARYEATFAGEKELSKDEQKDVAKLRATHANNPNNLTGDAFIKTLPIGRQQTLKDMRDGNLIVDAKALERTAAGQAFLDDLEAAYPGIDTSKTPTYQKNRADFTSGKESIVLSAANTALHHVHELYTQLESADAGKLGALEGFFGGNKGGRNAAAIAQPLSNELGKLYSGGVVTEGAAKEWEEKLNPFALGMTVNKLKDNAAEFVRLLGGRLETAQKKWDDGLPSQYLKYPGKGIASQETADFYKQITGKDLDVHDLQQGPGGTITPQNTSNAAAPQGPQHQVFNSATWKKNNPNGDVNAAIAQAKQQGFEVK